MRVPTALDGSVAMRAAALALFVGCVAAAEEGSDGTTELVATLLPAGVSGVVFLIVFLVARPYFPNVYAPRANWLRNAYGYIRLPEGLHRTLDFFWVIYWTPESEVIEKVGCDGAVFLRVFKLGLKLFSTCSVTAIMLIGVNATGKNNFDGLVGLSMANIQDGSDRLWAHVVGMWLNSLVVYWTLRNSYNEILAMTQEYKATKMVNYTVMVRNLPPDLREDHALLDYFKSMYAGTFDATVVRDIGKLVSKVNEYKSVVLDLTRAKNAWDDANAAFLNNPRKTKAPQRPTMRIVDILAPEKGLRKVDKIEYLSTRRDELRAEIDAIRDSDEKKFTTSGFVTFNSMATANAAAQVLHAMVPGTVMVEMAPEPREIFWPGVAMPPLIRKAGGNTVTLLKIPLVWAYITAILFIASMQNLDTMTNTPGLGWVADLPVEVRGIVQGLIPVLLLTALMEVLPMILRKFAERAGEPSESAIQAYVLGTHYIYQVVFVFFLTTLASAIFDSVNQIIDEPLSLFNLLGETVPAAGTFFLSYVLLQAFGRFPAELARLGPLVLQKWFLRNEKIDTEKMKAMEPGTMDYGYQIPRPLIIYLLCLAYANLQPIISFFGVAYFAMGYVTWKHQLLMVYTELCESGGTMWHRIFKFILVGVAISQATLIGVVAAKQGIKQGPWLIPLPFLTYFFYDHFDKLYGPSVSSKIVAREIAALSDSTRPPLSQDDLRREAIAYRQPELVYDLDDILYHSSLRCTTSDCLAQPPPREAWILDGSTDRTAGATGDDSTLPVDNLGRRTYGSISVKKSTASRHADEPSVEWSEQLGRWMPTPLPVPRRPSESAVSSDYEERLPSDGHGLEERLLSDPVVVASEL